MILNDYKQLTMQCAITLLLLVMAGNAYSERAVLREVWRSKDFPGAEIDSLAFWKVDAETAWIFVTGKHSDEVLILDALTGVHINTIGGSGDQAGQFRYPNGVAVLGDYLLIVERDNRRVQVFSLPMLESVAMFGDDVLRRPYGLTVFERDGSWELYVTDEYLVQVAGVTPLTNHLQSERVKHFRVTPNNHSLAAVLVNTFGATKGEGVLYSVETILADPENNLLFICDEDSNNIKVYTLDGEYAGRLVADGFVQGDPEGLAMFVDPDAPHGGYLVVTDQQKSITVFGIYDRRGEELIAQFEGRAVDASAERGSLLANTDGIALLQGDWGKSFRRGILIAIHDDIRVHAYSWEEVDRVVAASNK